MNRSCLAYRDKLSEKQEQLRACKWAQYGAPAGRRFPICRAGYYFPIWVLRLEDLFFSASGFNILLDRLGGCGHKGPEQPWGCWIRGVNSDCPGTRRVWCKPPQPRAAGAGFGLFLVACRATTFYGFASAELCCVNQGQPLQGRRDKKDATGAETRDSQAPKPASIPMNDSYM